MAFVKKTWKDRIVQYANRRLLTKSGGEVEQVTVTRDEGTISEAGDKFDAATMNDLENRIYNADTNMKAYIDGLIKTATVNGTTTSSGALEIPSSITPTRILNTVWNGTGLQKYAFCRGDNYLQVLENDGTTLKPLANAQVTFLVVYY